ncbi:MAG TPA: hypothetical protein VFZ17_01335 [Acidimicrobiia bacterium]|nr:hypothetical protein [Acidimicrobiia bacterium]
MVDDPRDDELATHLAVEPLDDLTRRRLVQRALTETASDAVEPVRRDRSLLTRFVAAAAVLLVVAVGVVSLLTVADGGNDTTVAGRKSSNQSVQTTLQAGSGSAATEQLVPESSAEAGASATAADAAPTDAASNGAADASGLGAATNLGEVGDLSTRAARRRLLAAIDTATFSESAPLGVGGLTGSCPLSPVPRFLAYGTAAVDGRDAFVVVNERTDGSRRVRLVVTDPCEVRQLR